LFPCENWVCFSKEYCLPICVTRCSNTHYFPNRPIHWIEKVDVSLIRKPSKIEAGESSTLFSSENWVSFWKEYYLLTVFSRSTHAHFVPNRPIQLCRRNTYISQRKPSKIETGTSTTLFPCENWVNF
jgi:hypothetical protein